MISRAILLVGIVLTAHAQMDKQEQCRKIVEESIEATKSESPELYSTIKSHAFEFSKSRDACVIVIQYRVPAKGGDGPKVQILARNAVTGQTMDGTKDIFLIPATDTKQIEDANNFLLEKFSR
jgi:hypothetical protein